VLNAAATLITLWLVWRNVVRLHDARPHLQGGLCFRDGVACVVFGIVLFAGPLLDAIPEQMELSPLRQMTDEERLVADFHGSGMSTGPHPMTYCREALSKLQVKRACDLPRVPDGQYTRVAGCVIARQRPGTAKGFVFLSLEDETGISNVIVNPDLYEKYRVVINREKFLRVEGILQNQDHTISIKASRVLPISITKIETESHDFH